MIDLENKTENNFLHKKQKHSGFPSPAGDYVENPININELLIKRASSTFLMRFKGNEMLFVGIKDNAILVIDRSITATNGNVVVASVDGNFICRRLIINNKKMLATACHKNSYIDIDLILDFEILGVVTSSINIY
ncbi:MAG: translesion error-prone DNA polymerase V autoproteolytic subunit [SAR86 cluster bacterium]|uniref:Translesion error-prone DNA polymerase V autoproteolytic subunit n=1 Tax=SAR86 cluster bacterium TaxID=2030880 RepID=A0A937LN79_9GAMM|nr:translesion error-prone DNA polymerase V autoproteolytic subunit [SAR86 cluster bacterium]MBL6820121.1 translesion error-prone DNA polymerase V autoproteolytic subunit [SAR86 cluster bacterium]MDA1056230.1 translesion error-prone DNA polymerase V autoproteolytic subunit [Pseudomonadota bacterium]